MPSNNKTPNLGLNKWEGNEYPKRQDFIEDNEKIDKAFKDMEDNLANAAPVKKVNGKIGDVVLKAEDIPGENGKSVASQLAKSAKEIENLKSSVGSGKDGLYSAIIGKKVIPRSKDFSDLINGVNNIKLGSGNATRSNVLSGKTFSNYDGTNLTGTMPNKGYLSITPGTSNKSISSGYYSGGTIYGDSDLKPENIVEGKSIFGINGTFKSVNYAYERIDFTANSNDDYMYTLDIRSLNFRPKIVILHIYTKWDDQREESMKVYCENFTDDFSRYQYCYDDDEDAFLSKKGTIHVLNNGFIWKFYYGNHDGYVEYWCY